MNSVRKVDFFIREFSYLGKEELLVMYFYSKSVFLILNIVLEVRYSEKRSKKRKYNSSNTYALKLPQRGLATRTKNVRYKHAFAIWMSALLENKEYILEQSAMKLFYHKAFDYVNHVIPSWFFPQQFKCVTGEICSYWLQKNYSECKK